MHYYENGEDDDKVIVASMYTGGYDWSAFALFRDGAGRLYTATDSGCSCNSPLDYKPDYEPVDSIHAAIAQARAMVPTDKQAYYYDYYSEADFESFKKEALEA